MDTHRHAVNNFRDQQRVQRDVVYLGWPIAPSYMSSNTRGGGELRSLRQLVQLSVHRSPNKLWRSTSIFNLWTDGITCRLFSHASSFFADSGNCAGILEQSMGAKKNRVGIALSYRPAGYLGWRNRLFGIERFLTPWRLKIPSLVESCRNLGKMFAYLSKRKYTHQLPE